MSRDSGLTDRLGIAPGPANGFTLDIIDCFERYAEAIDWAMLILNPNEPWPGHLVLPAARAHQVDVLTRVVDYGGIFWDDVKPGHTFKPGDHRTYRPAGWVEHGCATHGTNAPHRREITASPCSSSPPSGAFPNPPSAPSSPL